MSLNRSHAGKGVREIKFDGIEHLDEYVDAVIFWIDVSDLPPAIQQQAKQYDLEQYNEKGFGVCIHYGIEEMGFNIVTDTDFDTGESRNVFYIDNDGDKHWLRADIPDEFIAEMLAECRDKLPVEIRSLQESGFPTNQQM